MGRTLPTITDAEWSVLQLLWERGPATVRQLTDVLYPDGGASEYATVHKLLERLETKGYVRRDRGGGTYVFAAAHRRDEVVGQQLEVLIEKLCGGSLQPLLSNLVRSRRLTAEELRDLLALVDQPEPPAKPKKKRR
jgi:BlaI family transcriptional regulator, penicillinase repressor